MSDYYAAKLIEIPSHFKQRSIKEGYIYRI